MTVDREATPLESEVDPGATASLLTKCLEACQAWNRADLAAKLRLAQIRLRRPSTLICVVGEYKQGKSQLVNAVVGSPVCPADDDLATATITAVYGADEVVARVRRAEEGKTIEDEIGIDQLADYITEGGKASTEIDLVEVGIDSPTLDDGLTIIDTPGVGGLLEQNMSTTLRFLGLADAVIFVTDASRELTATEVSILGQVREVCPSVLVALSKIDLYPEWQRILDLNRGHLTEAFGDLEVIPVSSALRLEGLKRDDRELEEESRIPQLLAIIRGRILDRARGESARRATDEMRWALSQLLRPIEVGLEVLEDPESAAERLERLAAAQKRLEELQAAGARWSTVLNDGFADLRSEADFRLRSSVRETLARVDTELERVDPAADWEGFTKMIQEDLSATVAALFAQVETETAEIHSRISSLLTDDEEFVPDFTFSERPDAVAVWAASSRELAEGGTGVARALTSGLTALRGASSGMILLGVVGNLAGIALAAPVSAGAAVVFGTKQLLDTRRAALKQRRQEARTIIRQYIDEVGLETGNRTRQLVQESHRLLRDHYSARLQELSRSTAEVIRTTREEISKDEAAGAEKSRRLQQWAKQLHELEGQLDTSEGTVPA